MKKDKFIVTGMSCSNCSDLIRKTLSKKDGVVSCDISVLTKEMYLEYDEEKIKSNEVCSIVKSLGYRATLDGNKPLKNTKLIRLIISLVLLSILFVIANSRMFHMGIKILDENYLVFSVSQLLLSIAILVLNFKFYISGFKGIIKLAPNMDTLIMLSSFSAFVYSIVIMIFNIFELELSNSLNYLYFESGAMVLVLVSLGKYIESIAIDSTTKSIKDLVKFLPKTGNLLKDYPDMTETKIYIDDIKKDDVLLVKEGDTIPCDGIVIDGTADVDESLLTGESLYASKNKESKVYKATTLKHGFLIIKALSVGSNSMYDEIIELVNNSASSKAKIGRIADKICKFFVPFIILCAITAFIIWILTSHDLNLSFSIAISVLVVSCPCALGLATPVAVTVATGKAYQSYCLVKDATVYENLSSIKYALFDKTGTITSGDVAIKEIKANIEEDEFKKIVYSLEKYSNHPFALAIAKLNINNAYDVSDYSFLPTKGITGKIDNKEVVIGNYQYLKSLNIEIDDEETINTIYASFDGKYIGYVSFVDYVKDESIEAIKLFKEQGIKTVLISGDNNEKTKEVALSLGFDEYYGEVYPKDKDQILSSYLEKGNTLFIGDGINDSIAITNATVSMSMGTGADIAQNNSGVILKRNNLLDAYNLFGLSKKTINIIKGNLFWAFFYNIILIPIAMGALSSLGIFMKPMYGAIAMCCSSLFVCLNALRIKTYKYVSKNVN